MNPDPITPRIEKLLTAAAPVLRKAGPKQVVPPRVLQALRVAKEQKFPTAKLLTSQEMQALLLKLLAERPMDGFELVSGLDKAHFKLKDAGEGVIYGLLSQLESSGFLQAEWQERGSRMTKIYRLTDKGSGLLRKSESRISQLNVWSEAVLAFG